MSMKTTVIGNTAPAIITYHRCQRGSAHDDRVAEGSARIRQADHVDPHRWPLLARVT